ncbi:helix-turn-helix domain-containing protein [Bradyrhizobium sp. UFLA05-112]
MSIGDFAFLSGKLVCSPQEAMRAVNCRNTKFYELLNAGELQSYMDGSRRQIVVASLVAYVQRRVDAARAEKAA